MARTTRVIAALAASRPVVVLDERGTAELVVAAQAVTTSAMAFLIHHGAGFVRVALTGQACDRLALPPMTATGPHRCAQAVAVDAAEEVSTGISAADRCRTARLLADPSTVREDLRRPGHTVPVRAWPIGAGLDEPGVVEASIELATAAGMTPAAVLCGLISTRDPLHMADADEAAAFARQHELEMTSVAEVFPAAETRRRAG